MPRAIVGAALVGILLAVCSACGGGGGGGGGLEVTPASLTFTAVQDGPVPAPQSLHVRRGDPDLVYGYSFDDLYGPSWLRETTLAGIDTSLPEFDHTFAITTTHLTPGTYSARLVMRTTERAPYSGVGPYIPGKTVDEQAVAITYVVTAP